MRQQKEEPVQWPKAASGKSQVSAMFFSLQSGAALKPSVGGACDATSKATPPPKTILISDPCLLLGRNQWEGAEGTGSACLGLVMSGVHCQGAGKQLKLPTRLPACQFAGLILPAVECHCSGASCPKFGLGVGGGKPDLELGSARLPLSDAGQLWLPSMHGLGSA